MRTPTRSRTHATPLVALLTSALFLSACVTENPRRRDIPAPPQTSHPNRLLLSVGRFLEDSDSNGYVDSMTVSVYLFDERYAHAPIAAEGAIDFHLATPAGKELRAWSFDEPRTIAARTNLPAGPGYTFRLSLRDNGSDQLPNMNAELVAEFKPRQGDAFRSSGALPIRVGRSN